MNPQTENGESVHQIRLPRNASRRCKIETAKEEGKNTGKDK